MTTEDLTDVVAIEQDCHSKPWGRELFQRELDNPLAHVILCVVDESIAGYICFWDIAAEVEIHNVATTPSLRGMGVGRVLMDCVFSYIDSCKIDSAFLEVRSSNAIAIRLYEKFAFLTVDRRTNYYSDGEDALLMQWRRQSS
ncbi:MAG: ribosomal protein S18-alanine N-acetyltransferase [Desulfuromonas sp.]|nr:ribosomal protein S18-alanine N-acetyltransferase [Desulfuromonas sp.]